MAKCDEGYPCQVCGEAVDSITDSDLYLRYVIGMIDPEILHTTPDRHIRCNPSLAQFIVDESFPAAQVTGAFDKLNLDPEFRAQRDVLVTRGWHRLHELKGQECSILEYPLPEFRPAPE